MKFKEGYLCNDEELDNVPLEGQPQTGVGRPHADYTGSTDHQAAY